MQTTQHPELVLKTSKSSTPKQLTEGLSSHDQPIPLNPSSLSDSLKARDR